MKQVLILAACLSFVAACQTPVTSSAGAAADKEELKGPFVVVLETSEGPIKIELNPDKAPITVKNFLAYVDDKHYDGTIFHRVMKGFMIQGGGFDATLKEKATKKPIKNEASNGLRNERGTVAMARTPDPDSATAQFFINHADNKDLNPGGVDEAGYAVFGRVLEGMDVVDKIADVKVKRHPISNALPLETVLIKSVRRVDK